MTETAASEPDSLRLFFALWPDDATRDALYRTGKWLHQHWGGRLMRADTLHITLAFLGRTPTEQLEALIACADSVQTDAFELVLDRPGHWRHNHIGWLGPGQPSPQLGELVNALTAAIQQSGIFFDACPYVPHVTLLRNTAGGEVPMCEPVHWPVSDFVLVSSRTEVAGTYYDLIRHWSLT